MFSSQNEQDNRYYGKLSGLPILEPSSVAEAKEMVGMAFDLSEKLQEPVILRTTTRINHSSAFVTLGPIRPRKTKGDFPKDPMNYVTVPAVSRKLHVKLLRHIAEAEQLSEQSALNFIEGAGQWGIICNGVSYNYVSDAIREIGIADKVKVLRIGFSHPLPRRKIQDFVAGCTKVLVVEEGEPYLEEAVKAFAQEKGITVTIQGKADNLFSRLYELDPAIVREKVAAYFGVAYQQPVAVDVADVPEVPARPPTLCAGCSHRASFYVVKKAAEGMDVMHPTDIGCYTLGLLPPLSMADYLICMGSSTGTSAGFSKATNKKVISFIGDSTFFHSGIPGLVNAVFNNHNFTLVILDNGTTAMTGHQPHPGVDMTALGMDGFGRLSIESVVRGLGVAHVTLIRPYRIKKSIEAVKEAIAFKGVSVVISQETCTLYAKSLKKHKGKPFMVSDRCRNHRNCLNDLGCPAFYVENQKVCINPDLCAGCSICAQICPEGAIVPVKSEG